MADDNLQQLASLGRPNRRNPEDSEPREWNELCPLPGVLPEAPRLTQETLAELVPTVISDWILDIANRMQVPIESVAVACIGSVCSVLGRRVQVRPKVKDSWTIPCVVWTAIVARSGERKSAILSQAQKPITVLQARADKISKAKAAEFVVKKGTISLELEAYKSKLKSALSKSDQAEIRNIESAMEELNLRLESTKHIPRRYRTNDATIEILAVILSGNPAGILVVRDELMALIKSFDKQGRESDRAFYLEGWDASGSPFVCDRMSREQVQVDSLCLQVMGSIQPGLLESYVRQAVNGGTGDDGFLQRFQLLTYAEPLTEIEWVDEAPSKIVLERVQSLFDRLDLLPIPKSGEDPITLRFSPAAQAEYQGWAVNFERRFRAGDDHPSFVSHLSKYLRLMPILAMAFSICEYADAGQPLAEITLENAQRAITLCDFLERHARKVYAIVENTELRDADVLSKKILKGQIFDGMTVRDISDKGWAPFGRDAEAIRRAFDTILEPFGWARVEIAAPPTGRPSAIVKINPAVGSYVGSR